MEGNKRICPASMCRSGLYVLNMSHVVYVLYMLRVLYGLYVLYVMHAL